MATEIYASDLDPAKRTDAFMGKGFEDALRKAEESDKELIVGEFLDNSKWREI